PWPFMAIEGIQKNLGSGVEVGSKRVPDWIRVGGSALTLPIWYQRAASRSPPPEPAPPALTRMWCAVQSEAAPSGPRATIASKKRSSRASRPPVVPWAGTGSGAEVAGMVTELLVSVGSGSDGPVPHPPGSFTLRTSIWFAVTLSGPTTYPEAALGSMSVAGCGLSGPVPRKPLTVRKPVTKGVGGVGPQPAPPTRPAFWIT